MYLFIVGTFETAISNENRKCLMSMKKKLLIFAFEVKTNILNVVYLLNWHALPFIFLAIYTL